MLDLGSEYVRLLEVGFFHANFLSTCSADWRDVDVSCGLSKFESISVVGKINLGNNWGEVYSGRERAELEKGRLESNSDFVIFCLMASGLCLCPET